MNRRENWNGYLWQGRFASAPLDEAHLLACARYVELNPVRARMVRRPDQWHWSSARAHLSAAGDRTAGTAPLLAQAKLSGGSDRLTDTAPLLDIAPDWAGLLAQGLREDERETIRAAERTGRPLGSKDFVADLEKTPQPHTGEAKARTETETRPSTGQNVITRRPRVPPASSRRCVSLARSAG